MQIADARIFDHRHGLFMGGFGFGWESGNNIRTKCHIRAAAARLVTKSYDIAAQMASFHPPQNQIIAMLRRNMKMRHQAWVIRQHIHQFRVRFGRIQR